MKHVRTNVTVKRAEELRPGNHIVDALFGIPRLAYVHTVEVEGDWVHMTVTGGPIDPPDLTTQVGVEFYVVTAD